MARDQACRVAIQGAITAMVTPFATDGSVDLVKLEEMVNFQIAEGIDGLVPVSLTLNT